MATLYRRAPHAPSDDGHKNPGCLTKVDGVIKALKAQGITCSSSRSVAPLYAKMRRLNKVTNFESVRIESTSLILGKECTAKNSALRFHTASTRSGRFAQRLIDCRSMGQQMKVA